MIKFREIFALVLVFSVLAGAEKACRIESCSGWQLNRLPEVKAFLHQDAQDFNQLEVRWIAGATPELFVRATGEKIDLRKMNRAEMRELMAEHGCHEEVEKEGEEEDSKEEL